MGCRPSSKHYLSQHETFLLCLSFVSSSKGGIAQILQFTGAGKESSGLIGVSSYFSDIFHQAICFCCLNGFNGFKVESVGEESLQRGGWWLSQGRTCKSREGRVLWARAPRHRHPKGLRILSQLLRGPDEQVSLPPLTEEAHDWSSPFDRAVVTRQQHNNTARWQERESCSKTFYCDTFSHFERGKGQGLRLNVMSSVVIFIMHFVQLTSLVKAAENFQAFMTGIVKDFKTLPTMPRVLFGRLFPQLSNRTGSNQTQHSLLPSSVSLAPYIVTEIMESMQIAILRGMLLIGLLMAGLLKLGPGKTRLRKAAAKEEDGLPMVRDMALTPSKPNQAVSHP